MQGLPIQNKVVMPTKGEGKVSSNGVIASNEQKENDFSSIFKDVKKTNEVKVDSDLVSAIKSEKDSDPKKINVEEKVAGTSTNLDKLLNTLKGNSEELDLDQVDNSKTKNNFFPNKINGEESELQKDSPLDFLVKNAKTGKSAEVDTGKVKANEIKNFFPNSEKIANNLTPVNSEPVQNLKLVSGEEFVDVKSFKGQEKNPLNSKNGNIELAEVMTGKNQNASKVNGYQNGQSMLNDNLIKLNKEVISKDSKDSKKSKNNSIEELLSRDSTKSNDLSFVKDSQPLVINQKSDKNFNFDSKTNEAVKVLDLSKTNATTTNQLIEKISDYVMQSNVAGKDHLDLTVKHDSLGQFQIQVNKVPNQQQVDMQIMTSSHEGHKFFVENESALMKSLQQSGINLSDLRIVSSMSEVTPMTSSESKQFSSFNHNQNGASQSFESFQSSDYRQGSEKRKDLWNEYRERYGA